jgi:hypothetical protein
MMTARPTVADMMVAYAMDAVDHAQKAFGRHLDYSFASVEAVEEILTAMLRSPDMAAGQGGQAAAQWPRTQRLALPASCGA